MSKSCKRLDQDVLHDKVKGPGFKQAPFHYNLQYYANKTIDLYPEKTVLVLRSESIRDDLHHLEHLVGGNGTFVVHPGYHEAVLQKEEFISNDYGPLCRALLPEMQVYHGLLNLAANLDETTKEATVKNAAQRCGFSSWRNMETYYMRQQEQI